MGSPLAMIWSGREGVSRARRGRARRSQQQPAREMQMALICGGRLMVMAPLNSIRTRSPQEKQQA